VNPHVLGERAGLGAGVDRLAGDATRRQGDVLEPGVMSGDPTICSCARLSLTVDRPLKPITIAAIPKAIMTAPAANPPHSNRRLARACSERSRARIGRPAVVVALLISAPVRIRQRML
jgi:hypothetical protein